MGIGAYILIAGSSGGTGRPALLKKAGYRCGMVPTGPDRAKAIAKENPDVALVGISDGSGLDVIRALKDDPSSRHVPVVAVDLGYDPNALRACYDAGADDAFEDDAEESEIRARIVPLVRLAAMEGELLRRAKTAAEFGIAVDTRVEFASTDEDSRLLVVGMRQDQFAAMCPMLAQTGIRYVAEPDPYRARSILMDTGHGEFAGALVYAKGGDARDKCAFFFRSVRGDRRLFDLPLFIVAEEGAFDGTAEAYAQGANVVARMPVDCDFVEVHLKLLQRGRELRRALGQRLVGALGAASADDLGQVYSSKFIESHLKRLGTDLSASGRQSSAILFFVPTIREIAALYGDKNALRLRQQVADWLSSLVRVEDLVGRVGSDEFLMLLPQTAQHDADGVRRRVTGVLHQSEFGLADNLPVGVEVYIQSALVAVEPGDALDMVMDRARARLS